MHEFRYKRGELYCENVRIAGIAARFVTPFYLYSYRTIIDHYSKLRRAFRDLRPLICFSMKANSNPAVLRALLREGSGLDIVSGGELYKAQRAGADPEKIVYAGVGKTEKEISAAVKARILFFNVESEEELALIDRVACRYRKVVNVALRINPDIRPRTHSYITTGAKETKFGLDFVRAGAIFRRCSDYAHLRINGLHIHIGSQITEAKPFVAAIRKVLHFIDKNRLEIRWLNIGGGLGIVYSKERPQTAEQFARRIIPLLRGRKLRLILEPGRFIIGNSGILVTRILYTKKGANKNFAIVDAGMNDLMRPSIYGAYHQILPVVKYRRRAKLYDVVGPICESGDFLGKNRRLPESRQGELLAVMGSGAYGFSMSSNYNARPRIAEIMVVKGRTYVTRRAEGYSDLVRGEKVPFALR